MKATVVIGLVIEYARKIVSSRIGVLRSISARPRALECATSPRRAITVTAPGILPVSIYRVWIKRSSVSSRVAERPEVLALVVTIGPFQYVVVSKIVGDAVVARIGRGSRAL